MRKEPCHEQIFYDHIQRLIKNLFIESPNLINDYFYASSIFDMRSDMRVKATHILQELEKTKHLIGLNNE
jgi:hypothetical protein